jgi:4-amino-4-deoxy-L-arabinose transferase-like glycosyltransferase
MMLVTLPLARAWLVPNAPPNASGRGLAALFWAGMAFSILTKGPVVPALIVLAGGVLSWRRRSVRWLSALHPSWGIPLFLLLLLPWPVAVIGLRGPSLFVHAWQTDIYPKMISGQESHGAPPFSYFLASPLLLWPATVLLPAALELAWRRRDEAPVEFCWATVLPGWILFELAPTKLPHYIMPFVPLLAALMAASGIRWRDSAPSRLAMRLGAVLFAAGGAVVVAVVVLALVHLGRGVHAEAMLWISALLVAVGLTAVAAWRERLSHTIAAAWLCGALASCTAFGFTLPRLERLWVADRAAQAARAAAPAPAAAVVVGYDEPSLVFLLGERTRFERPAPAAAALEARSAAVAIVTAREAPAFLGAANREHLVLRRSAIVRGIDPVHGTPVALEVWVPDR